MGYQTIKWTCWLLGLFSLSLLPPARSQPPEAPGDRAISLESFRPQWHVGDRWIVETTTLPVQASLGREATTRGKPISWQFSVRAVERLFDCDCYRIEVRPLPVGSSPSLTTLWVERRSLSLRQVQTQLMVAGQLRRMTESYRFNNGQPAPILGPLTALPLDLPLFTAGRAKGLQRFSYEAVAGPSGRKALGDLGFLISVEQEIAPATAQRAKALLPQDFAKDLETKPAIEVRLKSRQSQVRQLWKPGCPWPVYVDNGPTVARLVKVVPAAAQPNHSPEVQP